MSLPITARQLVALRALQSTHPELGELATAIALAFDASKIDNPQMARLILEKTCRRIVIGQPGSHTALIGHLERFEKLQCLSVDQVSEYTAKILKIRGSATSTFPCGNSEAARAATSNSSDT